MNVTGFAITCVDNLRICEPVLSYILWLYWDQVADDGLKIFRT